MICCALSSLETVGELNVVGCARRRARSREAVAAPERARHTPTCPYTGRTPERDGGHDAGIGVYGTPVPPPAKVRQSPHPSTTVSGTLNAPADTRRSVNPACSVPAATLAAKFTTD